MSNKITIEDGVNLAGLLVGGMATVGPGETIDIVEEYLKMYDLDKEDVDNMFSSAKDKLRAFMDTLIVEDKDNPTEQ